MAEVKYRGLSPEQRIANRLRDSGCPGDVNTSHGQGPTRVHEHHHFSGQNHAHMRGDESPEQEKDTGARMYNSPEKE